MQLIRIRISSWIFAEVLRRVSWERQSPDWLGSKSRPRRRDFIRGEMLLMVLIAAPFIETLLHLPNGLIVPLVIAWPFLILSLAYLAWRPRGWLRAIMVGIAIHFLHNLVPAVVLLFS